MKPCDFKKRRSIVEEEAQKQCYRNWVSKRSACASKATPIAFASVLRSKSNARGEQQRFCTRISLRAFCKIMITGFSRKCTSILRPSGAIFPRRMSGTFSLISARNSDKAWKHNFATTNYIVACSTANRVTNPRTATVMQQSHQETTNMPSGQPTDGQRGYVITQA